MKVLKKGTWVFWKGNHATVARVSKVSEVMHDGVGPYVLYELESHFTTMTYDSCHSVNVREATKEEVIAHLTAEMKKTVNK